MAFTEPCCKRGRDVLCTGLGGGYLWNFCGCTGGPKPWQQVELQLSASLPFGLCPHRALPDLKHTACRPLCLIILYEQMRGLWVLRKGNRALTQYFLLILNKFSFLFSFFKALNRPFFFFLTFWDVLVFFFLFLKNFYSVTSFHF